MLLLPVGVQSLSEALRLGQEVLLHLRDLLAEATGAAPPAQAAAGGAAEELSVGTGAGEGGELGDGEQQDGRSVGSRIVQHHAEGLHLLRQPDGALLASLQDDNTALKLVLSAIERSGHGG